MEKLVLMTPVSPFLPKHREHGRILKTLRLTKYFGAIYRTHQYIRGPD